MAAEDQKEPTEEALNSAVAPELIESYELALNRDTKELILRDKSTGRKIALQTIVQELSDEEEQVEEISPLTFEQFRTALDRVDKLGLTWTADPIPSVKPKQSVSDDVFANVEFDKVQKEYPSLPRELGLIILHEFALSESLVGTLGDPKDIEEKAALVRDRIITSEFRGEFFFKRAIKVPYLTDIDWEVVYKLSERNIKGCPGIAYALLSLSFHGPYDAHRTTRQTVAVDRRLLDRLIALLLEARDSLHNAEKLTEVLRQQAIQEDKANATQ